MLISDPPLSLPKDLAAMPPTFLTLASTSSVTAIEPTATMFLKSSCKTYRYLQPSVSQEVQRRFNILKDHCFSVGREYNDIKRSVIFRCLIKVSEDRINDLISREKDEHESVDLLSSESTQLLEVQNLSRIKYMSILKLV